MSQISKLTGEQIAEKLQRSIVENQDHSHAGKVSVSYNATYDTYYLTIRGDFVYLPSPYMRIINAKFTIRSLIVNGDITELMLDYKGKTRT